MSKSKKRTQNTDALVVVLDKRGINPFLVNWLTRFRHVHLVSDEAPDDKISDEFDSLDLVPMMRCRLFKRFLTETRLPWLVMFDGDVIPLDDLAACPATSPLIRSTKDIASAHFVGRSGREAHGQPGGLAIAAMKISRTALQRIPAPWAAFVFNEDGTKRIMCECDFFAARAKEAGYYPVKAGHVAHVVRAAALPLTEAQKATSPPGSVCRIKLLSQLTTKAEAEAQKKKPPAGGQRRIALPPGTKVQTTRAKG